MADPKRDSALIVGKPRALLEEAWPLAEEAGEPKLRYTIRELKHENLRLVRAGSGSARPSISHLRYHDELERDRLAGGANDGLVRRECIEDQDDGWPSF